MNIFEILWFYGMENNQILIKCLEFQSILTK